MGRARGQASLELRSLASQRWAWEIVGAVVRPEPPTRPYTLQAPFEQTVLTAIVKTQSRIKALFPSARCKYNLGSASVRTRVQCRLTRCACQGTRVKGRAYGRRGAGWVKEANCGTAILVVSP